jgi:hypothetical protein
MSSFLDKKGFLYAVSSCEWGKLVTVSDEEPYSTIFASLKHPIRRTILRMLSKKPMSFSEMLGVLGVSSSFLTYHLENLGELVGKIDDNKYRLSSFGEAAIATMTKVEDIPTTAPQQLPRTRPNRVAGRRLAIAFGIICILLIASLGGALAYYTMIIHNKENELGSANNTISQLNTNVTNLQNQNNQTQMWLSGNVTAYNQLQDEVSSIHIWGTTNSTVWVNNETAYEKGPELERVNNETLSWMQLLSWNFLNVPSAGYVSVLFWSNSTSNNVGVLEYSNSSTFPFTFVLHVGSSGIIVFPVLPNTDLVILLDNSLGEPSAFTVTITYYY